MCLAARLHRGDQSPLPQVLPLRGTDVRPWRPLSTGTLPVDAVTQDCLREPVTLCRGPTITSSPDTSLRRSLSLLARVIVAPTGFEPASPAERASSATGLQS